MRNMQSILSSNTVKSFIDYISFLREDLVLTKDVCLARSTPQGPEKIDVLFPKGKIEENKIDEAFRLQEADKCVLFFESDLFDYFSFKEKALLKCLYSDAKQVFTSYPLAAIDVEEIKQDFLAFIENMDHKSPTLTDLHRIKVLAPSMYTSALATSLISIMISKYFGETTGSIYWDKNKIAYVGYAGLLCNISLSKAGMYELLDLDCQDRDTIEKKYSWIRIKNHPKESAAIILNELTRRTHDDESNREISKAVELHHENLDGSGYYGLTEESVPPVSRILRVAECYSAMTNAGYIKAKNKIKHISEALAELHRRSGAWYDPAIVAVFTHFFKDNKKLRKANPSEKSVLFKNYFLLEDALVRQAEKLKGKTEQRELHHFRLSLKDRLKLTHNALLNLEHTYIAKLVTEAAFIAASHIFHEVNNATSMITGSFDMFYEDFLQDNKHCIEDERVMRVADELKHVIFLIKTSSRLKQDHPCHTKSDKLLALRGLEIEQQLESLRRCLMLIDKMCRTLQAQLYSDAAQAGCPRLATISAEGKNYLQAMLLGVQSALEKTYFFTEQTKKECNINVLLEQALKLIQRNPLYSTQSRIINIEKNFSPDIIVSIYPVQIMCVIENILYNAYHAMKESGGILQVSTEYNGKTVIVMIKNTGPRIPTHVLVNMFTPGFTTKQEKEGRVGGRGFGLSNSLNIMRAHGGDLRCVSTDSEKTAFYLILPGRLQ